ncbi:helix-turn-helix domain-containing protein [Paenibacillus thalictri]|uniref:DNA topoisomerase (ATP-hydrolyzing) n=1 Tax=Paenibacillus thalictri TaxID=2527873 RepID=A0A4Q9DJH4_9BACL|nr:ArsR family transcriptional regulator [Paenibacillus thalictri]
MAELRRELRQYFGGAAQRDVQHKALATGISAKEDDTTGGVFQASGSAGIALANGAAKPIGSFEEEESGVFYSGSYRVEHRQIKWEPQQRKLGQLLALDGDKMAKVLAAIGHKQRLDILRTVLQGPLTGPELVERLNMGTTGQLYHHIKALLGADLLVQEERGGRYALPAHRTLPLLLLLAAAADLLDASDYIDMAEVRSNAGVYLGSAGRGGTYDPLVLLRAVVENSIMEHRSGNCSFVALFLHNDGSVTVADNGRGIPVHAFPGSDKPRVQVALTDLGKMAEQAAFVAPGSEKGISIAVANALCARLSVEIRRDGKVFRQDYKHGIPQTSLMPVGVTEETGTSVTFLPDGDIFGPAMDADAIKQYTREISKAYPELLLSIHTD